MNTARARRLSAEQILDALICVGINRATAHVDGEYSGGQCRVFKINFEDDRSLAMRVPYFQATDTTSTIVQALEVELHNLQSLEAKGFTWAPRCRACSLTAENPIRQPFIVLTWIDGCGMNWTDKCPPLPLRDNVLAQIARIQLALIECTLETGHGTTASFFERLIRNRRAQVLEGKIHNLTEQDCLDQQARLLPFLGVYVDDNLMAMDHGDLKPANIIVDKDYTVRGVIDWAFAAPVPLLRAAGLPRFLWPNSLHVAPNETVQRDRQVYSGVISCYPTQPVMSYMFHCQTGDDVDLRTLYTESFFSKGMRYALAEAKWKLSY